MSSPCNFDSYRVCKKPNSCSPRQGDEEIKEKLCPDPKTETSDQKSTYVGDLASRIIVAAILAGVVNKISPKASGG